METWSPALSFDAVWIKWSGPGIAKWCYASLQDKGVLGEDPIIPIPNKNRVEIIAGHCNVGNQVLGSQSKSDHKPIDGNLSVENIRSFQSALDVQSLSQCRRFRIENGYESSTRCRRRWWRSNVGERDADAVGDEVVAEAFQTVRSGNLYPCPSTPPSLIDSSLLGTNLSRSFNNDISLVNFTIIFVTSFYIEHFQGPLVPKQMTYRVALLSDAFVIIGC